MRLPLLATAALLAAGPAVAQDAVRLTPGHADLADVAVDDQLLAVRMGGADGRVLGTVTRSVTANPDGSVTVVTDADAPQAGFVAQDSARYGAGLRPLFLSSEGPGGRGTVTFDGQNVSGTYARGEMTPLPFDIDLETAAFDPTAVPFVAQALPLRAGYAATVTTFSPVQRVRETTLTVVGEEEVTGADGAMQMAWVVEEDAPGNRDRRFYIDGDSRALLQITLAPNPETVIALVPTTEEALAAEAGPEAEPLRPGDPSLVTDGWTGYTEDYTFKVVQPVQQDIGTSTRRLTIDEAEGTITLVQTVEIGMANQSVRDTLVAAWPSFEPISRRLHANETTITLDFADGTVLRTETEGDGEPESTQSVYDEPVFDGAWLQEVVRALPLAEGYRASFEAIGADGEAASVLVSVLESTVLDGGPAWVVETVPAEGPPTTYTIDADTREVLKTSFSPQAGVILETVPAEASAE